MQGKIPFYLILEARLDNEKKWNLQVNVKLYPQISGNLKEMQMSKFFKDTWKGTLLLSTDITCLETDVKNQDDH